MPTLESLLATATSTKHPKDISAYYRAMLNEGREDEDLTTLDDARIYDVAMAVQGGEKDDQDDIDLARLAALEAAEQVDNEQEQGDVTGRDDDSTQPVSQPTQALIEDAKRAVSALGKGRFGEAKAFAAKVDDDTSAEIERVFVAKEVDKMGPIVIRNHLKGITESDTIRTKENPYPLMLGGAAMLGLFTQEELDSMPVPGSTKDESNNPDVYKERRPNINGVMKEGTHHWWHDFADNTPLGQHLTNERKLIDKAAKSKNVKGELNYGAMSVWDRASAESKIQQRKTANRTLYTKAYNLIVQETLINSMELVGCRYVMVPLLKENSDGVKEQVLNKEGKVIMTITDAPKSILVYERGGTGEPVTVSTFLSYDVPKAIAAGGTLADLQDTAKSDDSDAPKETKITDDMTVDTFEEATAIIATWLDDKKNLDKLNKAVKAKGGAAFAHSVGLVYLSLEDWWTAGGKTLYRREQARLDAAASKEAEIREQIEAERKTKLQLQRTA